MNRAPKKILAGLLISAVVAPQALLFTHPQPAHAQVEGLVGCLGISFGTTAGAGAAAAGTSAAGLAVPVVDTGVNINTSITAGATKTLEQKECTFDGIAFAILKAILHGISNSIVAWIQSGFQGGPAFVTDLRAFLGFVDLEVFEEFVGSDTIALLCSPWRLNIEIALESLFFDSGIVECSLGDVIDNAEAFLDGDFSQGGWAGWIEVTTRSNPYTDFLTVAGEFDSNLFGTRARALADLSFGRGFLNFEVCEERPTNPSDIGGTPGGTVKECKTTTPGAIVEEQLVTVLGSDIRQLELADEINEIVSALIGQLINLTLNGILGS